MSDDVTPPPSAYQLAQALGDALPDPDSLPQARFALVDPVRRLAAAAVSSDVSDAERASLAARIDAIATELEATRRDPVIFLGRHEDGRIANLTQAGSGMLNPQAPPLVFDTITMPPADATPAPVEVVGRCRLGDAHSGPPERAHGGVVATLLDETLGLAATVAGASGLTAGINVRFRAGTPLHRDLEVRARYSHTDGRKHVATGEVMVDGVVTAEAEAIFIAPEPSGPQPTTAPNSAR